MNQLKLLEKMREAKRSSFMTTFTREESDEMLKLVEAQVREVSHKCEDCNKYEIYGQGNCLWCKRNYRNYKDQWTPKLKKCGSCKWMKTINGKTLCCYDLKHNYSSYKMTITNVDNIQCCEYEENNYE